MWVDTPVKQVKQKLFIGTPIFALIVVRSLDITHNTKLTRAYASFHM